MSDYITRQQLMRRGWSKALIDELQPNETVETHAGRTAYLYDRERILRLERHPDIARRIAKAWGCRRDYAARMCAHYSAIAGDE